MANQRSNVVHPDLSSLSYAELQRVRDETDRLLNTPPPILPYEAAEEVRRQIYRSGDTGSDTSDLRVHLRGRGSSRSSLDRKHHSGGGRTGDSSRSGEREKCFSAPQAPDRRQDKNRSKEKPSTTNPGAASRSLSRDRSTKEDRATASGHETKRGRYSNQSRPGVNSLPGYRIPKRSRSPLNEPAKAKPINPARQVIEDYVTNMGDALHDLLEEHRHLGGVLGHMSRTLSSMRSERCLWLRHQSTIHTLSTQVALFIRDLDPVFWTQASQNDPAFRKVNKY